MKFSTVERGCSLACAGLVLVSVVSSVGADNALSPVYAAQFGALGFDPSLDQDGDGFATCVEQAFYTDPTDATSYPDLLLTREGDLVTLEWNSVAGVLYRIEGSDDLEEWDALTVPEPGDGSARTLELTVPASLRFFRLTAANDDSDGDGLTNADEALLGTSPGKGDHDGDGLGDLFEFLQPNLDPLTPDDPDADQTGNGAPDLLDFAASLSGSVAEWTGGSSGDWHDAGNWSTPAAPGAGDVAYFPPGSGASVAANVVCFGVIGTGDLSITGAEFQVRHLLRCGNLELLSGATITSGGGTFGNLNITASGDVTVDATSSIDVTGGGYPAGEGPGTSIWGIQRGTGGSHGGRGGEGSFVEWEDLGPCYGSVTEPVTLGSGPNKGRGSGGGVVCLFVSGTLHHEGSILADGLSDGGTSGAGGSIWIRCAQYTGMGECSAQGAGMRQGGAGGGGRIAIYADSPFTTGVLRANGGTANNGRSGGAGSIYLRDTSAPRGLLRYDNFRPAPVADLRDGLTIVVGSHLQVDADIEIVNGTRLASLITQPLTIETTGDILIGTGAEISGYSRGHAPFEGPGASILSPLANPIFFTPAAGHAGAGGPGFANAVPREVSYGDFRQPVDLGSGGYTWGGGALRLTCAALSHQGLIDMDGEGEFFDAPTGSGGSVWITCQDFSGTGIIQANGGKGNGPRMGSGSGGRIAVYADTTSYTGTLEASSRADLPNQDNGAAGTVLTVYGGVDSLAIDNRSDNPGERTILDPVTKLAGHFTVGSGARVSRIPGENDESLEVIVEGDVTIEAGGIVELSGRNFGEVLIPRHLDPGCEGAGTANLPKTWGAFSHGTISLIPAHLDPLPANANYESGSYEYGSPYSARTTGSGIAAGGAIALSSKGTIQIDGEVDASAGDDRYFIAPSGGSIFLSANTLTGAGVLDIRGGDFDWQSLNGSPIAILMPGGSAGRISIYTNTPYSGSLDIQRPAGIGAVALLRMGPPASCDLPPPTGPDGPISGSEFVAQFPLNVHTGAIKEVAPPGDLRQDALESDQHIHMFPGNKVRLVDTEALFFSAVNIPYFGPVTLDATAAGTYDETGDLVPFALANLSNTDNSQYYTSYILHADAPAGTNPTLTGSVTFDQDIIGVRVVDLDGIVLRELIGAPFQLTPNNDNGLELDAGDSFSISPDKKTLTVTLNPGTGVDRLIVVTDFRDDNEWTP